MIGIVYVKNKLFYINPFLNILGFNFYDITFKTIGKNTKEYQKKTPEAYFHQCPSGDHSASADIR